jgi:hypothetical protein
VKTSHDAERRTAIIEARLNAPELVRALRAGARLPLALYRMEGKAPRSYLASRLARPSPTFTSRPGSAYWSSISEPSRAPTREPTPCQPVMVK